jgi:ribosomal-protein-alanine N-acetyltransferase
MPDAADQTGGVTTACRQATPDDAAAIVAVEREAFGADAWSAGLVDLELIAPGRVVVAAEQDGAVVGYASAAVIADVADLTRIAVRPASQRAGVARALQSTLVEQAAERGAQRMMLEVDETNEAALGLYRSVGFEEISRRRDYYGKGIDAVVMELASIGRHDTLAT